MNYEQAKADHEYLQSVADLHGEIDSDLLDLLASPTQDTAAEILQRHIQRWFSSAPYQLSRLAGSLDGERLLTIMRRYGCSAPATFVWRINPHCKRKGEKLREAGS